MGSLRKRSGYMEALATSLVLLCPTALWGQASPLLSIHQAEADAKGNVRVLTAVTDSNGRAVSGLSAANFAVAVEGEEIRNARFERTRGRDPLSVILAMDVSGSMRGPGIDAAKNGASEFLSRLDANDFCALLSFGEGVRLTADFTRDRGVIEAALASLDATDAKTHLYQAVFDAVKRAKSAPTSRSTVVVLTDGRDDGSSLGVEDVIAQVTSAGVPVYTLAYGPGSDVRLLGRISTLSGAVSYVAPEAGELRQTYAAIVDQLNNEYLLTFLIRPLSSGSRRGTVVLKVGSQTARASFTLSRSGAGSSAGDVRRLLLWLLPILAVAAAGVWYAVYRWRQRKALQGTIVIRPASQARGWLEVTRGPHSGMRFPLREKETVIGRTPKQSQCCLKDDPLVSGKHARILLNEDGQFVVEDEGSANKTKVNEVELAGPLVLQSNDRIQVGLSELLFIENR